MSLSSKFVEGDAHQKVEGFKTLDVLKTSLDKGKMKLSAKRVKESKPDESEASCIACTHFQVCAFYLAVKPLVSNWPIGEENSPVTAEELAKICRAFARFTVRVFEDKKEG